MPAEAILAPGWTDRASLYFDLTEKAVGGLVRRSKDLWRQDPLNAQDNHGQGVSEVRTESNDQIGNILIYWMPPESRWSDCDGWLDKQSHLI